MKFKRQRTKYRNDLNTAQEYAEKLVRHFNFSERMFLYALKAQKFEAFNYMIVEAQFNTAQELASYQRLDEYYVQRVIRQMTNLLKSAYKELVTRKFKTEADLPEWYLDEECWRDLVSSDNLLADRLCKIYFEQSEIDNCETLKEIAKSIHLQLEVK